MKPPPKMLTAVSANPQTTERLVSVNSNLRTSANLTPVVANVRTSGHFEVAEEADMVAGREIGAQVDAEPEVLLEAIKSRMNMIGREAVRLGYELLCLKGTSEHGDFGSICEQIGISHYRACEFMRMAKLVTRIPQGQRMAALALHKSKLNILAGADAQVVEALLEDGTARVDVLSVRALRDRIRELEATTTDLQVQRDTAEAEAAGLKKRLDKGLPDRSDSVPMVVADLRAEIMALGKKASLVVDSFTPLGADLMALVGTDATAWGDATLRLAVAQLQALQVQLHGVVRHYMTAFPAGDAAPQPMSYLSQQEMREAAASFDQLTQVHSYEAMLRDWEREQARPKGKGRPKAKPVAPGGAA